MEKSLIVKIPEELHRQIKIQAFKEGKTIKEFVKEVFIRSLEKKKE